LHQSLSRIIKILKTEHFRINNEKLRILGPRRRVAITGLIKDNSEAKFSIGRNNKRHMRAVVHHHFLKKDIDRVYSTEESILGWMAFLRHVDSDNYERLNDYFLKLRDAS